MQKYNTQFLQAVVSMLEHKARYMPRAAYLLPKYRQRLAEAEACEAAYPTAADVIAEAKKALEDWRDGRTDHENGCPATALCFGSGECECEGPTPERKGEAALAKIAAWEAA